MAEFAVSKLVVILVAVVGAVFVFLTATEVMTSAEKVSEGFSTAHTVQTGTAGERAVLVIEKCSEDGQCNDFSKDVAGMLTRQPYDGQRWGAIFKLDQTQYKLLLDGKERGVFTTSFCILDKDGKNPIKLDELYYKSDEKLLVAKANGQEIRTLRNERSGFIFEKQGDQICIQKA
jgi:hypothetical protein